MRKGVLGLTDEQKILLSLKNKNRDSLEKVIKIYTPYVRVIAYGIIGNVMTNEDVEEVIADTFISLWKSAENLDAEKGSVRAYLGTIARNCSKNKLRELRPSSELDETIPSAEQGPVESFEAKEERNLLVNLIMELGEPDSEIFIRYYYYEQKIRHIANYMKLPVPTVKTKLSRGRFRLKQIYEKHNSEGQTLHREQTNFSAQSTRHASDCNSKIVFAGKQFCTLNTKGGIGYE